MFSFCTFFSSFSKVASDSAAVVDGLGYDADDDGDGDEHACFGRRVVIKHCSPEDTDDNKKHDNLYQQQQQPIHFKRTRRDSNRYMQNSLMIRNIMMQYAARHSEARSALEMRWPHLFELHALTDQASGRIMLQMPYLGEDLFKDNVLRRNQQFRDRFINIYIN